MKSLYQMKKNRVKTFGLFGLCLCLVPAQAMATDFTDYDTANGTTTEIDMPTVTGGWFTATDFFPSGTAEVIDGQFEAEGRMIVANDRFLYLQRTYGSSQWDVVATLPEGMVMDPSFVHVSPDGSQIALGAGYMKPLFIIPTSALSATNPPDLNSSPDVTQFPQIAYYDGDWKDNQYFVVNGGQWPTGCEPPYEDNPNCVFQSGVGAVDTQAANPATHVGVALITSIPGASSDVDVDSNGNLITGLGYATGPPNRTGELKVWAASEWDAVNGSNLNYGSNAKVVATNMLSVASLGEDAEGNLHVGGGDAFGTGGADENGYVALINGGIVNDIATGVRTTPVIDGNKTDNGEYRFLAPDPCQDDSATSVLAGSWGRELAVMWNPSGNGSGGCAGAAGSASDYWAIGVTPRVTIYYPDSAPDTDGDGIADSADNAYMSYNPNQDDSDGDGYGNIADADFNNDNLVDGSDYAEFKSKWNSSNPHADMDSSGLVDGSDFAEFKSHWNQPAPYY